VKVINRYDKAEVEEGGTFAMIENDDHVLKRALRLKETRSSLILKYLGPGDLPVTMLVRATWFYPGRWFRKTYILPT